MNLRNIPNAAEACAESGGTATFGRYSIYKYMGFSLLLTYHYVLWFLQDAFFNSQLMGIRVTHAWLVNLIATALVMTITTIILGRKRHLSHYPGLAYCLPVMLSLGTLAICYMPASENLTLLNHALAFILGGIEGLLWILWSECLIRSKAKFSMTHIGPVFGSILLISLLIGYLLPYEITPIFIALFPLLSGRFLVMRNKSLRGVLPQLLPHEASKPVLKNIAIICAISFATSAACYYITAIVPWENLPVTQDAFTVGIIVAALLILAISGFCVIVPKNNIFHVFPYLLVFVIVGLVLYVFSSDFYFAAFLIATSTSALLEVFLIMYFGSLVQRGYLPSALAFTLIAVSVRIGIVLGNSIALTYEAYPVLADTYSLGTALLFMCLLSLLLVPMSKRESVIIALTSTPATPTEIDTVCADIATEFGLSEREKEILKLIARGNTAQTIANKLVISPHTVNTHIRHVYEKTNIHKRSELIEYINMRRDDE